jgi:hypothetical protein
MLVKYWFIIVFNRVVLVIKICCFIIIVLISVSKVFFFSFIIGCLHE